VGNPERVWVMAGTCTKAVIGLIVALAFASGASAASPDVSAMNLQASDVPGAKIVTQRAVNEQGYLAAYYRSFVFSAPSGSARLVAIRAETALAASSSRAVADVAATEKPFRSPAGRKALIAAVAQAVNIKVKAIVLGQPHKVAGYDQGFEVAISVGIKGGRIYENLVVVRLDRVLVQMSEFAGRPITAGVTAKYMTAIAGHIGTQLAPIESSPPTVTGTPQQDQTLTATAGAWTAGDATFGYQWQRCDAAGANCADVAGATAETYAVTAEDVGATLRVVVTATNRFGSAPGTSVQTAVVTAIAT
jgi:hypothetical protein